MSQLTTFAEVVDAADSLSLDEQETLIEILQRRAAERKRRRLIEEVEAAEEEFARGECRSATVEEIMKEILS